MHAFRTFYAALQARTAREEGQALVEYALIIGLVALVAVGALTLAGGHVNDMFSTVASKLNFPG